MNASANVKTTEKRAYRFFPLVTALFVTCLVVSNIIAVKIVQFAPNLFLPSAVILFPLAYIFGDILTEVYGFAKARQVIWTGFFCNLVAVAAFWIAGLLPAAPFWAAGSFSTPDASQQAILGYTPRLLLASFIAYLIGEFLNSIVLAKLKVRTAGRFLWLRTISSTIVGEGADSLVFITIAFFGVVPTGDMATLILGQWWFKVIYEVIATPLTYVVVRWLKRVENEDFFDRGTNFNPVRY